MNPAPAPTVPVAEPAPAKDLVRTDEQGRKWLGNVPYDVWFEDPLAVAAEGGSDEPASTPTVAGTTPAAEPTEDPVETSAKDTESSADWPQLISGAVLDDEAKRLRNQIGDVVQSVGRFNQQYKSVQAHGTTLAAVGEIARIHTDPVRWKENAGTVRDLGVRIREAASSSGREAYAAVQEPYEQFRAILDGNPSAESAGDVELAQAAPRGGLMQRIGTAFESLRTQVQDADSLKSSADEARHEAAMLAAFAHLVVLPGYEDAEDEGYAAYAKQMRDAGVAMQQAIVEENFDGFSAALSRAQNSCNDCHANYRSSGSDQLLR